MFHNPEQLRPDDVVNDILSGIEVVVDMIVCISFEAVIISAITSFVFTCLLDIVYIISSNSSCGVTTLMTHALVVLYKTDFLRKKDVSSDSFTPEQDSNESEDDLWLWFYVSFKTLELGVAVLLLLVWAGSRRSRLVSWVVVVTISSL